MRRLGFRTHLLGFSLLVAIHLVAAASARSADAQPNPAALAKDLAAVLAKADLGKTVVAVRILDLGEPGKPSRPRRLYSRLPDRPLVPASNMKLRVTAA
ncbi:MAG: hypothetical protein U9R68_03260, partial [Planctomycetota bacterium]|nr:hypothetical protein [Planctomycetota bacterium]